MAAGAGGAPTGPEVVGSGVAWLGAAGTGGAESPSGAADLLPVPDRPARVPLAAGFGELGFPVPPPPPPRTVAEPAAVGGLTFQPFPDPRPGGGFGSGSAFADEAPEPARRSIRRPSDGGALSPSSSSPLRSPSSPSPSPSSSFLPSGSASGSGSGLVSGSGSASGLASGSGSGLASGSASADAEAHVPSPRSEPGHSPGDRPAADERSAGHRAADGEVAPEADLDDDEPGGRHTVPDELVRAATYRLPPDRVFRAKVRDTAPEDPAARRSVPKPRQS